MLAHTKLKFCISPPPVKTGVYLNKCLSLLVFFTQPPEFQLQLKAIFCLSISGGKSPAFPSFAQSDRFLLNLLFTCSWTCRGDECSYTGFYEKPVLI